MLAVCPGETEADCPPECRTVNGGMDADVSIPPFAAGSYIYIFDSSYPYNL